MRCLKETGKNLYSEDPLTNFWFFRLQFFIKKYETVSQIRMKSEIPYSQSSKNVKDQKFK